MKTYDIAIIGGGPGGYVAAIKAAQLGAKVALFERDAIGGVCLNVGCIPTKTLLNTAKIYQQIQNASTFGIDLGSVDTMKIDWPGLMSRKEKVVRKLVKGVEQLLKKNQVDVYPYEAKVVSKNKIQYAEGEIACESLIIATGSSNAFPPIDGLKEARESGNLLDSTGILSIDGVPESLVILGGGFIAVEFATFFSSIGTTVTMLQRSDQILTGQDQDVRDTIQKHLKKTGVNIRTGTEIIKIDGPSVQYRDAKGEKEIEGTYILASLGRRPNLSGIESLSLELNKKGIRVDEHMRTSVEGVYAIGDVVGGYMLAHVASAEGIVAVENIMGASKTIDYGKVPSCIYSFPEVGMVGLTEEQAREQFDEVIVSTFPLAANGKALAEGESTGFVKIIAEADYGEVVGIHIVASHATDMIAEAVATMELEGTIYDLAKAIHPHPTLSEVVMEAAHGAVDQPIHIYKPKS